jgi:hypothetical protein
MYHATYTQCATINVVISVSKDEVVPLHAMEALGGEEV